MGRLPSASAPLMTLSDEAVKAGQNSNPPGLLLLHSPQGKQSQRQNGQTGQNGH